MNIIRLTKEWERVDVVNFSLYEKSALVRTFEEESCYERNDIQIL
jgi:hypothetical protein